VRVPVLEALRPRRYRDAVARLVIGGVLCLVAVAVVVIVQGRQLSRTDANRQAAVARGRYDFSTGSCISCHALYSISSAGGAVDLTHEGSRRSYAWLQHEIRFPTSQRPPTPAGQADDLAAFLSSLK
jgi:mono/diheme cytochrome c family protein